MCIADIVWMDSDRLVHVCSIGCVEKQRALWSLHDSKHLVYAENQRFSGVC